MSKKYLIISMENGLVESSLRSSLGILIEDLFYQAYEENLPFTFFSLLFPYKRNQVERNNKIITKKIRCIHNLLDSGIEIIINTNLYSARIKVYEYPLKNNTSAYFLFLNSYNENSEWLNKLVIHGERNKKEELFIRYILGKATFEAIEKLNLEFDVLHLHECDTAFAIESLLSNSNYENIPIFYTIYTSSNCYNKYFSLKLIKKLYEKIPEVFKVGIEGNKLNLHKLVSYYAKKIFINSLKHEEVEKESSYFSKKIFPLPNAISRRWINEDLSKLFDEEIPDWRKDENKLRKIMEIENKKLEKVLNSTREKLMEKIVEWDKRKEIIKNFTEISFQDKIFTFAKKLVEYERLLELLRIIKRKDLEGKNVIFLFSGQIEDENGKNFLRTFRDELERINVKVAYILNYDKEKTKYLVSGSDFWINIPKQSYETSETDFMKAMVNGRIVISTLAGNVVGVLIDGLNGIVVEDNLSNLLKKIKYCIRMKKEEYIRLSKTSISFSPNVLMGKYMKKYLEYTL